MRYYYKANDTDGLVYFNKEKVKIIITNILAKLLVIENQFICNHSKTINVSFCIISTIE